MHRQIASVVIADACNATFQIATTFRSNPPHRCTAGGSIRGLYQSVGVGGTCVDARIERVHTLGYLKVLDAWVVVRGAGGVVCVTPDSVG